MATNEILQFAGTVGADNLITQADYLADAGNIRTIGNVPGIADDRLVNKALRQATLAAAALAQFVANNQANNILDTLTPATLAGYIQDAILAVGGNRVTSIVSSATPTPAADTTDEYIITAQAVGATFGAPTSATATLYEGQVLIIRVKDNGTAQTIAWNAIYRDGTSVLPVSTIVGKTHYIALLYNVVDTKWDCVGVQYV